MSAAAGTAIGGASCALAAAYTISQTTRIFSNLTFCILSYHRSDAAAASDFSCVVMWQCCTALMAIEM